MDLTWMEATIKPSRHSVAEAAWEIGEYNLSLIMIFSGTFCQNDHERSFVIRSFRKRFKEFQKKIIFVFTTKKRFGVF